MASKGLASPAIDATVDILVDWLEFEAFFNSFGIARVDEVGGALKIQEEEANDNIGAEDAALDQMRLDIENEIARRSTHLGSAYPFELSSDGEQLVLQREGRCAPTLYLLCLVLSHLTRSAILAIPPVDAAVRDVRKRHFQIFSTIAVAGLVDGPSLSLGWPRPNRESILEVVSRGCAISETGAVKEEPGSTAEPTAKDGGIDVLAWTPDGTRPPPLIFWFGQAASGHNWKGKSSRDLIDEFLDDYYLERPRCNHSYVTICPFLVSDDDLARQSMRHGTVLDRLRAPAMALRGLGLAAQGLQVEEATNAFRLSIWLGRYRKAVRTAA